MDFDPEARERTFKVKIVAAEGLTVTTYIKEGNRPRIAYSLRASGLAPAGRVEAGKAA